MFFLEKAPNDEKDGRSLDMDKGLVTKTDMTKFNSPIQLTLL